MAPPRSHARSRARIIIFAICKRNARALKEIMPRYLCRMALYLYLCGCAPIIGAIKGAITIVPVTLIFVLSAISPLLLWPFHMLNGLYTLWSYTRFGPNVKFFLFILSPVPIALYPLVILCASIIASVCIGFLYPFGATFSDMKMEWTLSKWPTNSQGIKCGIIMQNFPKKWGGSEVITSSPAKNPGTSI